MLSKINNTLFAYKLQDLQSSLQRCQKNLQESYLLDKILFIIKSISNIAIKTFRNIYVIHKTPLKESVSTEKLGIEERICLALEKFEKGDRGSGFKYTDLTKDDIYTIFKGALQSSTIEDRKIIEHQGRQYVVGQTRIKANLRLYDVSDRVIIGEGCGQTAYKVLNLASGKSAVFKTIGGTGKPKGLTALLGASLLRKIHNRGILRGIEKPPKAIVTQENKMGYVTHYCNKGNALDLAKLSNSEITDEQKIDGIHQLFCGYATLEENGIYHGDIKPDNILLNKEDDGTWRFEAADFDVFSSKESFLPFFKIGNTLHDVTQENIRYLCAQAVGRCFYRMLTGDTLSHTEDAEYIRSTLLQYGYDKKTAQCIYSLVNGKTTIHQAKTEWEHIYKNNPLIQRYINSK